MTAFAFGQKRWDHRCIEIAQPLLPRIENTDDRSDLDQKNRLCGNSNTLKLLIRSVSLALAFHREPAQCGTEQVTEVGLLTPKRRAVAAKSELNLIIFVRK